MYTRPFIDKNGIIILDLAAASGTGGVLSWSLQAAVNSRNSGIRMRIVAPCRVVARLQSNACAARKSAD